MKRVTKKHSLISGESGRYFRITMK